MKYAVLCAGLFLAGCATPSIDIHIPLGATQAQAAGCRTVLVNGKPVKACGAQAQKGWGPGCQGQPWNRPLWCKR